MLYLQYLFPCKKPDSFEIIKRFKINQFGSIGSLLPISEFVLAEKFNKTYFNTKLQTCYFRQNGPGKNLKVARYEKNDSAMQRWFHGKSGKNDKNAFFFAFSTHILFQASEKGIFKN